MVQCQNCVVHSVFKVQAIRQLLASMVPWAIRAVVVGSTPLGSITFLQGQMEVEIWCMVRYPIMIPISVTGTISSFEDYLVKVLRVAKCRRPVTGDPVNGTPCSQRVTICENPDTSITPNPTLGC